MIGRNRTAQSGDTLVEVAMSLAILAVTLVSSFTIANASYGEGIQAREHTQAIYLVQEQAERLQMYRDTVAAANPTAATILNSANFSCPGTCHMNAAGALVAGADTALPFGPSAYNVTIAPSQWANLFNPVGNAEIKATITATWTSAVSTDTGQNTTSVNVILVDRRNIIPRDCSIAGSSLCV